MSAEAELAQVGDTVPADETFDDSAGKASGDDVEAPKDESAEIELIKESEGWVFPKVKVRCVQSKYFCAYHTTHSN